jgi:hypothetical protein
MAYDSTDFNVSINTDTELAKVLKDARDLIEVKGWGQNFACHYDKLGRPHNFCMLGAVMEVARDANGYRYDLADKAEQQLKKVILTDNDINKDIPESQQYLAGVCIPYYNDRVAKTKEEVLAVFDRAISSL